MQSARRLPQILIPVSLVARYQVNAMEHEGFFGSYRFSGRYYQDEMLNNADEHFQELAFGSEYKKREQDLAFEVDGITVFMDKRHGLYLMGTTIDYHNGLDARGFTFENPNASATCGCGSSFSV